MSEITNYNFYLNNGYCVLNLFDKKDIEELRNKIMKKLNTISMKKIFDNKEKKLEKYKELVINYKLHSKLMNPDTRYINLSRKVVKKVFNNDVLFILKKQWGHNYCCASWIGNTTKKNRIKVNSLGKSVLIPVLDQFKINATGFRIVRPIKKEKNNDAAEFHLDVNTGGTIRNDLLALATMWIPVIGFSSNYTLNLSPGSHKYKHNSALKQMNGKITPIFSKKYIKKFKFIRPNLRLGQAILLHPNTIHGGSINKGIFSRISLDLRMLNLKRFPV